MLLALGFAHLARGVAGVALGFLRDFERGLGLLAFGAGDEFGGRLLPAQLLLRDRIEAQALRLRGLFGCQLCEPLGFELRLFSFAPGEADVAGIDHGLALVFARDDGGVVLARLGLEFGEQRQAGLGGSLLPVLESFTIHS